MAQWDGKESSCSCDCGFDIPKGGRLDKLTVNELTVNELTLNNPLNELTLNNPLGLSSGGLGASDAAGARGNLGIYVGRSGANTISAASPKSVSIDFGVTFTSAPHVIVCPGFAGDSAAGVGIFTYLQAITEGGCTVRLATNYTGDAPNVYVFWIAIGNVAM